MTAATLEAPAANVESVIDLHFSDLAAEHAATRRMLSRVRVA